jgi:hypothetical protein
MNRGSSAPTGSAGQSGDAAAMSCVRLRSRPSFIATLPPVRSTTRQGTSPAASKALSTLVFKGVLRPPRGASSAVITTFAPQSTIREASASGEKPAKTMECTAPIRAQASIA